VPAPRLDHAQIASAMDLMPSAYLVMHEWDRHSTCSGLSAGAYFGSVLALWKFSEGPRIDPR
jgi:ribonuclease T2